MNEEKEPLEQPKDETSGFRWGNVFTEYYRVNRELHKADQERYAKEKAEGKKEPWTKRELAMLAVCILCGIGIILRWLLCKDC